MADSALELIRCAFDKLMGPVPGNLDRKLRAASLDSGSDTELGVARLFEKMAVPDPNEDARRIVHDAFIRWDSLHDASWTEETQKNTKERRLRIYGLLGLAPEEINFCDTRFGYGPGAGPIVISEQQPGWCPWYSTRRIAGSYYWDHYKTYLRDVNKWDVENLESGLERSATEIVERLADPCGSEACQCKGLVVGYVQSGKTANFTGVIAKAADAGYRLIIVLAGTIDILRDQTQRRIDRELIGIEMLGEDVDTYCLDDDWVRFTMHGGKPRALYGTYDWVRLTGLTDYQSLHAGIPTLQMHAKNQSQPLASKENLEKLDVRLAVVKKNSGVLNKLLRDLRRAGKDSDLFAVPTLIIDDESDQASINTVKPPGEDAKEKQEKTAINKCIQRMLKILNRAQYVGYTATPFANVFVNPDDAEDLFPRDFIVSLPRPAEYMGVSDFFDDRIPAPDDYTSNRKAFVRFVRDDDGKPANLPQAIDSFVLAGAVKLYRESRGFSEFRHHTMLVHHTNLTDPHKSYADTVRKLYEGANYIGGGPGIERLKKLFTEDFQLVSNVRKGDLTFPALFNDLKPFIAECIQKIGRHGKPVRILNGKNREDAPNFEKDRVWSIIVGGAKLSRGYTVEGLTISYYRRRTGAADTLMQMGRWFGFRRGYQDLVRLFIGDHEPAGKKSSFVNLYEAFEGICRDEEDFRQELQRYADTPADDPAERITPIKVVPLVSQHMLIPTARNKMHYAKIVFENPGGQLKQPTVAPSMQDVSRNKNEKLMKDLISSGRHEEGPVSVGTGDSDATISFRAITHRLKPEDVLGFLDAFRWRKDLEETKHVQTSGRILDSVLDFLKGNRGNPEIDSWLLLSPQMVDEDPSRKWFAGGKKFDVRHRALNKAKNRYLVYSESSHVIAARFLSGLEVGPAKNSWTASLKLPRQAVVLFYPVLDFNEEGSRKSGSVPTMGFALQFPANHIQTKIRWEVSKTSEVP
jgi:hypothetical protein